jgi:hypothetical protein
LEPGEQLPVHMPVVMLQTYWHAVPVFCHMPLASQVCGCIPLHCFAFGVHAVQVPPLQTFGQAAPLFCQVPALSQVCGWRFMHCLEPGEQLPAHMPVVMLQT